MTASSDDNQQPQRKPKRHINHPGARLFWCGVEVCGVVYETRIVHTQSAAGEMFATAVADDRQPYGEGFSYVVSDEPGTVFCECGQPACWHRGILLAARKQILKREE